MDRSLEELVRLAATGDADATSQLLNASSGLALNWARQMVSDENTAQSIAQNSLVSALSNLGMLQDPSQYEGWLYAIVSNAAASVTGAAAGAAAAAQPAQGQPYQQPAQGQPYQQPVQQPAQGQPYQQPILQVTPDQNGGKKQKKGNGGSGRMAIIAVVAVLLILLCIGGGFVVGRIIVQRQSEGEDTETIAETEEVLADEDIPGEGETDPGNLPQESGSPDSGSEGVETAPSETTPAETGAQPVETGTTVLPTMPETQAPTTAAYDSSSLSSIAAKALAENGGYVLPDSDKKYYSSSELNALSAEELRVARNEIYARHNRTFDSADLQAYFNGMPWYNGTISPSRFVETVFNDYEKKNIEAIQAAEKRK